MSNPFLDELIKVANDMSDEPMNPDLQPEVSEDDVAASQIENEEEMLARNQAAEGAEDVQPSEAEVMEQVVGQAIEEEVAARGGNPLGHAPAPEEVPVQEDVVEQAEQGIPQDEEELIAAMGTEQVANEVVSALLKEASEEIITLATIAKIAQCAKGGDNIPEELQKEASALIEEMTQDESSYYTVLEKTASELFGVDENVRDLFSQEGMNMVFEQLASLEAEGMDKQADEDINSLGRLKTFASDFITGAKQKVIEAANSAIHLKQISADLNQASEEIAASNSAIQNGTFSADELRQIPPEDIAHLNQQRQNVESLAHQRRVGMGVRGAGMGLAAAGAAYGGKKLYDHMHEEEEKTAGVLPDAFGGGTLNAVQENDYTGGIQKMAKEMVNDFLKLAGAAGLVSIVNDENQPEELRKEASEAFDEIAKMSHTDMSDQLVKVAQQIYSEGELHEIVAGYHTETIFEKVAYFVDSVDASFDEVFEKTANAGGVAAVKNLGAGLKDAAGNIVNVIGKKKQEAEGAGREYIGALKGGEGSGAARTGTATGLAGGGLVGAGAMAGYNVINNPSEYNIEQTAAAYEEAVLAKQAAVEAYAQADAFTQSFQHLFNQ